MGSTTWRRRGLDRAIESDLCYYFDRAKMAPAAAAADSNNIDDYPNPDLAVEVDVSPPKIDRSGIYAALGLPEFWRARKRSVSIEQLDPDGNYVPPTQSRFLPVRPEDVTRRVFSEGSSDLVSWEERLRAWVRNELVPQIEFAGSVNFESDGSKRGTDWRRVDVFGEDRRRTGSHVPRNRD